MSVSPLACARCKNPLPLPALNTAEPAPCPACGTPVRVVAFPALIRANLEGTRAQTIILDDESSCYYHSTKKATVPCDACGRFLCSLCDVELGGRHLCPSCVESGQTKAKIEGMTHQRVQYDAISFDLAFVPVLLFFMCWPAVVVTAPLSIYFAVRHWRTPLSILPRVRWRFVLAFGGAALEILAAVLVLINFVSTFV